MKFLWFYVEPKLLRCHLLLIFFSKVHNNSMNLHCLAGLFSIVEIINKILEVFSNIKTFFSASIYPYQYNWLLRYGAKRKKSDSQMDFINVKNFSVSKYIIKWKRNSHKVRKYLKIIYLTKDLSPECIKNFCHYTEKDK